MDKKQISFSGELVLLEERKKRRQAVELWLLNDAVTENGGRYTKLSEHKNGFVNTPILVAYIGDKIGDGHNFEEEKDENGDVSASFMSAFAERVVGWFDKEEDLRIENKNGKEWIVGKGYILTWYAKELVEKLRRQGARGMSVSIETLVWNVKEENGVEVFGDYEVLGTTILGDDVPPAVKGANIKLLNAIGAEELRKMTIKVASADGKKPKKSDKGENRMNITDVRAAFPDLKVLCVKGENIFALNSKNAVVMTSAEKDGENVICGKVVELSLNASAVVGEETVEIPVDSIIEAATAELADLRKQNKEATEQKDAALKALSEMQKAEKERRLSELKEKVNARAADLEKCFGVCVESELLAKLTSEENLAKYCEMVDAEGKYCGLSAAIKDLDNEYTEARLHSARIKANSKVTWGTLRDDAAAEKTDDFEKVMEEIN